MLANPLSMQATVLRIPDFFVNQLPSGQDLVEEGDILYDVLKDVRFGSDEPDDEADASEEAEPAKASRVQPLAWVSSIPVIGVQPVLTLPDKVGKYLAHEHLKALICFVNGAVYPLFNLRFRIDVILPQEATPLVHSPPAQSPRRSLLVHKTCPHMNPKSSNEHTVDVLLSIAGTYVLDVNVLYVDPSGEERKLSWASSFVVEQAITEVSRRLLRRVRLAVGRPVAGNDAAAGAVRRLDFDQHPAPPLPPPTQAEALANLRLPLHSYLLTIDLENTCSVPLTLCRIQLVTALPTDGAGANKNAAGVKGSPNPLKLLRPSKMVSVGEHGGPNSDASTVFLQPGERYQRTFEFLIMADALRNMLAVYNSSTGVSLPLLKPPLNGPLGYIEWEWRRWNGDGGIERSRPVLFEQLVGLPMMELVVVRVRPASSDSDGVCWYDGSASSLAAPIESGEAPADIPRVEHADGIDDEPLLVGRPVELELCIVNYGKHMYSDSEAPVDVAIKVRPEKLAPYWLYTGAIPCRLAHVELHSTLSFKLTLLPWRSGWLPLPRDSLQIVDARSPERVLAPLPPVLIESTSTALVSSPRIEVERQSGVLPGSLIVPNATSLERSKVLQTAAVVSKGVRHEPIRGAAGLRVEEDPSGSVLCEVLVL
ncbi:unnamed protein product [Phytomonas sp. EM1]|nr:unnamed protein product [Phytomonas sp. EM1]|eukprot:CCW64832.1 unnamed protein product [Phytomonas sp. isolate EM1]